MDGPDKPLGCVGALRRWALPEEFLKNLYSFPMHVCYMQHPALVQIKEVVLAKLNPTTSVQATVDALAKYVDSEDLVAAIHLNRHTSFDPTRLVARPQYFRALDT